LKKCESNEYLAFSPTASFNAPNLAVWGKSSHSVLTLKCAVGLVFIVNGAL